MKIKSRIYLSIYGNIVHVKQRYLIPNKEGKEGLFDKYCLGNKLGRHLGKIIIGPYLILSIDSRDGSEVKCKMKL